MTRTRTLRAKDSYDEDPGRRACGGTRELKSTYLRQGYGEENGVTDQLPPFPPPMRARTCVPQSLQYILPSSLKHIDRVSDTRVVVVYYIGRGWRRSAVIDSECFGCSWRVQCRLGKLHGEVLRLVSHGGGSYMRRAGRTEVYTSTRLRSILHSFRTASYTRLAITDLEAETIRVQPTPL